MENTIEYRKASNNLTRMHEIGHAVVALLLGATEVGIATKTQGGLYSTLPTTEIDASVFQNWSPEERLMFLMAGYAGELLYKEEVLRKTNHPDSQYVSLIFKKDAHANMAIDFQIAMDNGLIARDDSGDQKMNSAIENALNALIQNRKLCGRLLMNLQKRSCGLAVDEISAAISEIGLSAYVGVL